MMNISFKNIYAKLSKFQKLKSLLVLVPLLGVITTIVIHHIKSPNLKVLDSTFNILHIDPYNNLVRTNDVPYSVYSDMINLLLSYQSAHYFEEKGELPAAISIHEAINRVLDGGLEARKYNVAFGYHFTFNIFNNGSTDTHVV